MLAPTIANVAEVSGNPDTLHREMVVELEGYRGLGASVKLFRTPATIRRPPTRLDEQAAEIAAEHGLLGS